jgi:hypothetical protein
MFASPPISAQSRAIGRNGSIDGSGSMSEARTSIEPIRRCVQSLKSANSCASLVAAVHDLVDDAEIRGHLGGQDHGDHFCTDSIAPKT